MLLPGYKLMDKDHFCIKVAEKRRNKYKAQIHLMERFFGLKNYIPLRGQLGENVRDEKDTFGLTKRTFDWINKVGIYKKTESR